MRFNTNMAGPSYVDIAGERVVFLETSFVATDGDGLVVTGRLAADGGDIVGLQDISIRIEPDAPLTPARLRRVPWSKILDAALDDGARTLRQLSDGRLLVDPGEPRPKGADVRLKRTGGRRRLDDDHYREVAKVYRSALHRQESPKQAVAAEMHCATSTAGEWIFKARKLKFLGDAPAPGAKGEVR